MQNSRLCRPGEPQRENQRKWKERQVLIRPCQRTKKAMAHESEVDTIVIAAHGTISDNLIGELEELKIGGRAETIQTTALLRPARILRRVLES